MANTPRMWGLIHHRENQVEIKGLNDLSMLDFYINWYFM